MSKKAIEPIKGRVLGIDYSWHQGEMNFDKAAAAGAHFGFCRAGSIDAKTGIPYVDYQFRRNAELAPIRLLTGYYWYFRPQFSVELQMEFFCNLIRGKVMHLPPILDVEIAGPGLRNLAREALDLIHRETGWIPMVYTRGEFWRVNVGLVYWAKNHRLIVARYTKLSHPWADSPKSLQPPGWDDWTFWQWSADENRRGVEFGSNPLKGSKAIDLQWFNGDLEALRKFARLDGGDPFPVQPTPAMGWKEAIDAWARTQGYAGPKPG
jgi:GH25 family lysozyme M1 (1,4-beta-N-acetylmuramidase)